MFVTLIFRRRSLGKLIKDVEVTLAINLTDNSMLSRNCLVTSSVATDINMYLFQKIVGDDGTHRLALSVELDF